VLPVHQRAVVCPMPGGPHKGEAPYIFRRPCCIVDLHSSARPVAMRHLAGVDQEVRDQTALLLVHPAGARVHRHHSTFVLLEEGSATHFATLE
jgi:hypothetical protein